MDSDVFGSVTYHARSNRRFLVWVFSVVGGVINAIGIVLTEVARLSN